MIGTDHPSLKSLSFTTEMVNETRFTGVQLASGGRFGEDFGACARDGFDGFCGTTTGKAAPLLLSGTCDINDVSAPERSSSKSCGMTFRSSALKPTSPPERRPRKGDIREKRGRTMHALCSNDHTRMNIAYKTQVSNGKESCKLEL